MLQPDSTFDIVFSKINMPGVDGIELIRHLHQLNIDSAVILVSDEDPRITNSISHLAREQGLQFLGALFKPLTKSRIEKLLEKYNANFELELKSDHPAISISELRQAILNKEIEAYFQPQICVKSGRLIGAEALAHWRHPSKGLITAEHFIPLAEKHGFIQLIGHYILDYCCAQLGRWQSKGVDISLSINISPLHLNRLDLPDVLCAMAEYHGIQPKNLIIELTEASMLEDVGTSIDILSRLRLRGFQLSIDDYGTGHSSLDKLQQIPFNELKIDRSFIKYASDNEASRRILEATVDLAKKLKLKCVAEGVEHQSDWEMVSNLQCDIAQGFYISRPMPARDFMPWIESKLPRLRTSDIRVQT
ncbi:EAL domain-containing protein (putative c-di-GMP-specific phosphodiesterase class I) [Pseudoteredinibacter isoporae]|uniref:EAL domain-containing protein (Putative c-di-GMP-specific phosphodiesterase class I) n=2 Tax=Pseudoteredinibacter isoporae TaxID=570281 RepID=A0A7X0JRT5_9GAMM|nr:EAL domain-containing protein (putative c-di-GMP-specific phosphodiesterase class I) [Pseudoteredinibacter isoporae]